MPRLSRVGYASAFLLLLAGCQQTVTKPGTEQSTPPGATQEQKLLAKSLETWQQLKTQNGEHYRYKTSFASFFGFGSTTTLTVQAEKVIARTYESYSTNDEGGREAGESWTEEGAALGSHEAGAALRTVDELYGVCRSDVLTQNPLENDLYLVFRDDEVLKTCEYFPKNCADDCFMGVSIAGLEFLPTKPD